MSASRKGREGRKEGKKFCSEAGSAALRHSVGNAFDSIFKTDFAEVDQQPETTITQSQLSENLFAMDGGESFDRFQFNDDLILDQKVSAETFVKNEFIIVDGNCDLSLDPNSLLPQFVSKADLVNRFKQSGASLGVNLERRVENGFGQLIFVESGCGFHKEFENVGEAGFVQVSPAESPNSSSLNNLCALGVLRVRHLCHI